MLVGCFIDQGGRHESRVQKLQHLARPFLGGVSRLPRSRVFRPSEELCASKKIVSQPGLQEFLVIYAFFVGYRDSKKFVELMVAWNVIGNEFPDTLGHD